MRFVPSISSASRSPDARQVMGLSAAYAVKPVHPGEHPLAYVEHLKAHPELTHPIEQDHRHVPVEIVPVEERRKACRRVSHQHVLIELRSGIDRRHHNLREGDVAEHIDETA